MGIKVSNASSVPAENGLKPAQPGGISRKSQGSVRHPDGISPELRKILDRKRQKSKEQQSAS